MTDRTAVPERVSQRAKTARRGAVSGSQAVGDYVGQPAGEAAQAVRRAGLRPGLDRSFGCPAELVGLVVAQDPVAGSDLARNGMVTLYVAAPGGEPVSENDDAVGSDSEVPVEAEPSTPPAAPVRARRRKPGHARPPIESATSPSPPTAVESTPPEDSRAGQIVEAQEAWPGEIDAPQGALEDELADEQSEREFPHEDFVVHVEDVLAGRSRLPGWRRTYPPRRLDSKGRFRGWLGEHRLLAGVVGLALGLWVVVGVASMLDGHHAHSAPADAVSAKRVPGATHPDPPSRPTTAPKLSAHRTTARHAPTGQRQAAPRRGISTAPRHVRAASTGSSEAVAPTPRRAPASTPSPTPRASTPPAPAPEQSGGGLFSP